MSASIVHPSTLPPLADSYLTHRRGILSWLLTKDHKRIAILYMIGILAAFFIGGVENAELAVLLGVAG
jgi:cytochrome c oxidase subunit 1